VRSIGFGAFWGCSGLASVTISEGVQNIGYAAFTDCSGLTSVMIPASVQSIGSYAFDCCSGLKVVAISAGVTNIGEGAFAGCSGLKTFEVDANNEAYKSVDGLLLTKDGTKVVSGINGDIVIPLGVMEIGDCAFCRLGRLTSVTLPECVTNIGAAAFSGCGITNMTTIPMSVKRIGSYAFSESGPIMFTGLPLEEFMKSENHSLEQTVVSYPTEYRLQWSKVPGIVSLRVDVLSSVIRASDPTILDVVYKVVSVKPTAKVRVLAFEDGVRSVSKILRPETFVADMNGVETAGNVGDNILPNVEHTISWRVSSDWQTKLAKVKFEVLASEGELFPLRFVTIPASDQYGKMKVSVNAISESQLFDALMWLYADRDPGLLCGGGILCSSTNYRDVFVRGSSLDYGGTWVDLHTETEVHAKGAHEYVFGKIKGYSLLNGTLLNYVNSETRLGLSPSGSRQYVYKFVEE